MSTHEVPAGPGQKGADGIAVCSVVSPGVKVAVMVLVPVKPSHNPGRHPVAAYLLCAHVSAPSTTSSSRPGSVVTDSRRRPAKTRSTPATVSTCSCTVAPGATPRTAASRSGVPRSATRSCGAEVCQSRRRRPPPLTTTGASSSSSPMVTAGAPSGPSSTFSEACPCASEAAQPPAHVTPGPTGSWCARAATRSGARAR